MTPIAPCCAIAIASSDSVTVSIAALASGTLSAMLRVNRVRDVHLCRHDLRVPWNQQDVVEREGSGDGGAEVDGGRGGLEVHVSHHWLAPWHFLYFLPLPHGHGSFRPTFGSSRFTVLIASSPPTRARFRPRRAKRRCGVDPGSATAAADPLPARPPDRDAVLRCARVVQDERRRTAWRRSPNGHARRLLSEITGRSHHIARTISSSTRAFMSWNRPKLSRLYSTSGSRWP